MLVAVHRLERQRVTQDRSSCRLHVYYEFCTRASPRRPNPGRRFSSPRRTRHLSWSVNIFNDFIHTFIHSFGWRIVGVSADRRGCTAVSQGSRKEHAQRLLDGRGKEVGHPVRRHSRLSRVASPFFLFWPLGTEPSRIKILPRPHFERIA
jgi:hypothetical protein